MSARTLGSAFSFSISDALVCWTAGARGERPAGSVSVAEARTEDVREADVDRPHLLLDRLLHALRDEVAAALGGRQRQLDLRPARRGDSHRLWRGGATLSVYRRGLA